MQLVDIFALIIVCIIILGFSIILWGTKGGSSKSFMSLSAGATYNLLSEDKKRAVEKIVERNAGKKLEEHGRSDPKTKKIKKEKTGNRDSDVI